ncbi:hypothetical protein T01_246 [Trichinella spiralis]|uniref:Uncharacterized protein n=1 Tax=Trichinella spiralis TaxID=6334 RepID=A0A0V0ZYA1_TRISP|nr:hypothetical protein T01_246 [Trichinella spiralis]
MLANIRGYINTLCGFIIALPAINHVIPSSFETNTLSLGVFSYL